MQVISFIILRCHLVWSCSRVYASPNPAICTTYWHYLINLHQSILGSQIMLGDLNKTLISFEVIGSTFLVSHATTFAHVLHLCQFMNMETIGGTFTWCRNGPNGQHIHKNLDRCLANPYWRLVFPHALSELFPPHNSNHNHILLSYCKSHSKKTKLFHFQVVCLTQTTMMLLHQLRGNPVPIF